MTMLEDLWYGNVNPHELFLDNNRPFKHLMGNNRDKLTDTLTDQQKELLENYDNTINEMDSVLQKGEYRKQL